MTIINKADHSPLNPTTSLNKTLTTAADPNRPYKRPVVIATRLLVSRSNKHHCRKDKATLAAEYKEAIEGYHSVIVSSIPQDLVADLKLENVIASVVMTIDEHKLTTKQAAIEGLIAQAGKVKRSRASKLLNSNTFNDLTSIAGTKRLIWTKEQREKKTAEIGHILKEEANKKSSCLLEQSRLNMTKERRVIDLANTLIAGVSAPKTVNLIVSYSRIMAARFWRAHIKRITRRELEMTYIKLGKINGKMKYISDTLLTACLEDWAAFELWVNATRAVNISKGYDLPLASLLPTKDQMLAEFYEMVNGFASAAETAGLELGFLTITLEGKYHNAPSANRASVWSGIDPASANKELMKRWALVRALLAHKGVKLSGFRSTEPHKDGTPHGHALIAYLPQDRIKVMSVLLEHFPENLKLITTADHTEKSHAIIYECRSDLEEGIGRTPLNYANNRHEGAQSTLAVLNTNISKAASYVAKYVIKGDNDRVRAWRETWGARGIQWFGINNSVGLWRECRRKEYKIITGKGTVAYKLINDLRHAAAGEERITDTLKNSANELASIGLTSQLDQLVKMGLLTEEGKHPRTHSFAVFLNLTGGLAAENRQNKPKLRRYTDLTTGKTIGLTASTQGTSATAITRPDTWMLETDEDLLKQEQTPDISRIDGITLKHQCVIEGVASIQAMLETQASIDNKIQNLKEKAGLTVKAKYPSEGQNQNNKAVKTGQIQPLEIEMKTAPP